MRLFLIATFIISQISFSSCSENNSEVKEKPGFVNASLKPDTNEGYWPESGFIKSDSVAFDYGMSILKSIYGEDVLKQKPFNLSLYNDSIWILEGTLPEGVDGGVAHIEFEKRNGRIIKVNHGK